MFEVDPDWGGFPASVSFSNAMAREMLSDYMKEQLSTCPELVDQVLPWFAPGTKRMILDDSKWFDMLKRENVTLRSGDISTITDNAIIDNEGMHWDVDVIIYGTGFYGDEFVVPVSVTGLNGQDLHQKWNQDAKAYNGVTVSGFPNMFMLYGPNTNIVFTGTTVFFSECEVRYMMNCIEHVLRQGAGAIDCKEEVYESYNQMIDHGNSCMPWGAIQVSSWYRNKKGRIAQNWPFSMYKFWQRTKSLDIKDYNCLCKRDVV